MARNDNNRDRNDAPRRRGSTGGSSQPRTRGEASERPARTRTRSSRPAAEPAEGRSRTRTRASAEPAASERPRRSASSQRPATERSAARRSSARPAAERPSASAATKSSAPRRERTEAAPVASERPRRSAQAASSRATAAHSRNAAEIRQRGKDAAQSRSRRTRQSEVGAASPKAAPKAAPKHDKKPVVQEQSQGTGQTRPNLKALSLLSKVCLILIALLFVAELVIPDHATSEAENRSLQTFPNVSVSSVLSGRFQEDFTDYISDQFPLRSFWVDIQVLASTITSDRESNGVYLGKGGYLIEDFQQPDNNLAVDSVKAFADSYSWMPIHAMIVPTASSLLADRLPATADTDSEGEYAYWAQQDLANYGVDVIDVTNVLSQNAPQAYYHTDHHWTSYGAYLAFQQAAPQLGIDASTSYDQVLLTEDFSGSLKSKSGYFFVSDDSLSAYLPTDGQMDCIVTYVSDQRKTASPFEPAALDGSDAYQVFFGGNHPLVRIESTNLNGRCLMVVKDSYANCFIPFLINQYERIIVVDPRYCFDDIGTIISNEGVTETLFLYNASTFAGDTSLAGMMGVSANQE